MKKLSLLFILLFTSPVFASYGTYDFEDLSRGGGVITVQMTGVKILIVRSDELVDTANSGYAGFGSQSLSPFNAPNTPSGYIIYPETPISKFSCEFGDANADVDTLTIWAYNALGEIVDTDTATLPSSTTFTTRRLTVEASGIKSLYMVGGSVSAPNSVYYDNLQIAAVPLKTTFTDNFGGKPDYTVFRPNNGLWWTKFALSAGYAAHQFGVSGDKPISGDWDGNNYSQETVFRNGIWYFDILSGGRFTTVRFGLAGDIPLSADFDNDGKSDITVFRPSNGTWYWLNSSDGGFIARTFGQANDIPVPNDYDGDGRADICFFRPSNGTWYMQKSSDGSIIAQQFGLQGDKPTPADYDGDGRTDFAVYRPNSGVWYLLQSNDGFLAAQFGLPEDAPVPNDYIDESTGQHRDGKANIAVWRPSTGVWYILKSTNVEIFQWGSLGDVPLSLINQ